jgi:hypothetical protein
MDFTYWVEQEGGQNYFYATLKSKIEIGTSGTQVYNMVGFQFDGKWDYLRCAINFDGAANANANSRYWYITDHWSSDRVYNIGVPKLGYDSRQDWQYNGDDNNKTECPPLEKCVFQCSAYRKYDTGSSGQDYNFNRGGTTINFYYGVYYVEDLLLQGGMDWTNFFMPLTNAVTLSASAFAALATILIAF